MKVIKTVAELREALADPSLDAGLSLLKLECLRPAFQSVLNARDRDVQAMCEIFIAELKKAMPSALIVGPDSASPAAMIRREKATIGFNGAVSALRNFSNELASRKGRSLVVAGELAPEKGPKALDITIPSDAPTPDAMSPLLQSRHEIGRCRHETPGNPPVRCRRSLGHEGRCET